MKKAHCNFVENTNGITHAAAGILIDFCREKELLFELQKVVWSNKRRNCQRWKRRRDIREQQHGARPNQAFK